MVCCFVVSCYLSYRYRTTYDTIQQDTTDVRPQLFQRNRKSSSFSALLYLLLFSFSSYLSLISYLTIMWWVGGELNTKHQRTNRQLRQPTKRKTTALSCTSTYIINHSNHNHQAQNTSEELLINQF
jgi:hypothetical protein